MEEVFKSCFYNLLLNSELHSRHRRRSYDVPTSSRHRRNSTSSDWSDVTSGRRQRRTHSFDDMSVTSGVTSIASSVWLRPGDVTRPTTVPVFELPLLDRAVQTGKELKMSVKGKTLMGNF